MTTLNKRYNYGLDLFLLSIDEGISGYRDDSLETVKRNEKQYEIPLKIVSYKVRFLSLVFKGSATFPISRKHGIVQICTAVLLPTSVFLLPLCMFLCGWNSFRFLRKGLIWVEHGWDCEGNRHQEQLHFLRSFPEASTGQGGSNDGSEQNCHRAQCRWYCWDCPPQYPEGRHSKAQ